MIASYPSALKTEKRKQLKSFTRVTQKEDVIDYFLDDIKKLTQPTISETPSVEAPKRVFTRPRITRLSLNETPSKPTMQFEDQTPISKQPLVNQFEDQTSYSDNDFLKILKDDRSENFELELNISMLSEDFFKKVRNFLVKKYF
jgi:hypothetical protein